MNIPFFHLSAKGNHYEPDEPIIVPVQKEHNITEGSEFLDDAIRVKDQPLMYTEECVAPGGPEGLL
jgi:hypothetical protein